jgi:hypothetical protein
MTTYSKDRLKLVSQGITGGKIWHYSDTGAIADVADVAGFFTNASEMGVDTGDLLYISANDGQLTKVVRGAAFWEVRDTGATQGSVGPSTLIGDTG